MAHGHRRTHLAWLAPVQSASVRKLLRGSHRVSVLGAIQLLEYFAWLDLCYLVGQEGTNH